MITECLEKNMMLRLNQKSVESMMDVMSKFFKAGMLVLDTCTSISETGKPSLQLPEHGKFVEHRRASACFNFALLSFKEVDTMQRFESRV